MPDAQRAATTSPTGRVEAIRAKRLPPPGERGQVRSTAWIFFQQIGVPNPDQLSIATYRQMELDPQVRAGVAIRELAILGKPGQFTYTPTNPNDPKEVEMGKRMVDFLTWVWDHLSPKPHIVMRNILSARRFGFAVLEKVWASARDLDGNPVLRTLEAPGMEGFVYIERCKLLLPESFEKAGFAVDEYGHLHAVYQYLTPAPAGRIVPPGVVIAQQRDDKRRITFTGQDLQRLIIYSASPEAGNWYGQSDLKPAYNFWFSKQAAHAARNVLLERLSGVLIGEYDNPESQTALEAALQNVAPGAILTVPKESNVRILEGFADVVDAYHESIRYDDIMILRALLVPNLAVGGSTEDVGSFARATSDFDSFVFSVKRVQHELEEVVDEQFAKPLIEANFGNVPNMPRFQFPEMHEKDRSQLAGVFTAAIRDGYVDPAIDAQWLRDQMGIDNEVPDDYQFQRPTQPSPFGTGPFGAPPGGERGQQRGPDAALPARAASGDASVQDHLVAQAGARFETVDQPDAHRLVIDGVASTLLGDVASIASDLQRELLNDAPKDASDAELAKIRIPKEWLARTLDAASRIILARVQQATADTFRALGRADLAKRIESVPLKAQRARILAASSPVVASAFAAFESYRDWAAALNAVLSEQAASDIQNRLRLRVLQAYSSGAQVTDIPGILAEEFASYTSSQLQTVARTTVMDYFNSARNATIDAAGDGVIGVRFVPLEDEHTTPFCRALAGRTISRRDALYEKLRNPPFGYNCRTTIVPVLSDEDVTFDTDWPEWIARHENDKGGEFVQAGRA